MHIILGVLGTIVTVLILLNRLSDAGIDIGWLDPFKWQRRRKWKQKYSTNPVFLFSDPMEATAGLMYSMIKNTGDISLEEKNFLLSIFQNDFYLSEKEASQLLSTCSFQIKDESIVTNHLSKYFQPNLHSFSSSQKDSAIILIEKAANFNGHPNERQTKFLANIKTVLQPEIKDSKWK